MTEASRPVFFNIITGLVITGLVITGLVIAGLVTAGLVIADGISIIPRTGTIG